MKSTDIKGLKLKNILFYAAVLISVAIIVYFLFNPNSKTNNTAAQPTNTSEAQTSNEESAIGKETIEEGSQSQTEENTASADPQNTNVEEDIGSGVDSVVSDAETVDKEPLTTETKADKNETKTDENIKSGKETKKGETNDAKKPEADSAEQEKATPAPKAEPTEAPVDAAVKIVKSDITQEAKFYPYEIDNIKMEVVAVKASDGTIRTALNTCQICFDSGRGYYEQVGEFLTCQNCGNRFHIDQIEKIKGGCNPVPIMEADKTDNGDFILISKDFMEGKKELFSNWQKAE